jgi:hypothetical protein
LKDISGSKRGGPYRVGKGGSDRQEPGKRECGYIALLQFAHIEYKRSCIDISRENDIRVSENLEAHHECSITELKNVEQQPSEIAFMKENHRLQIGYI